MKKKLLPVPLLIVIDLLLTGVALCVFAWFHHVRPEIYSVTVENDGEVHEITSEKEPVATTIPVVSDEPSAEQIMDAPENTTENTTVREPEPIEVEGAEVLETSLYKSEDIEVLMTKYSRDGVIFYVEDIYISHAENFRTAFAQDVYAKAIVEDTLELATRKNAVCAINGDYYGNGNNGVVIRNGHLYRSRPDEDVLVMYYDGTMKVFSEDEFDGELEMLRGAYQAWCFGPVVEYGGKAISGIKNGISGRNPRSAVGYFEAGHYCFVCVEGRSDVSRGVTLDELGELFELLGCELGYNMDGGNSAAMTFEESLVNTPSWGGRATSDILYIAELE